MVTYIYIYIYIWSHIYIYIWSHTHTYIYIYAEYIGCLISFFGPRNADLPSFFLTRRVRASPLKGQEGHSHAPGHRFSTSRSRGDRDSCIGMPYLICTIYIYVYIYMYIYIYIYGEMYIDDS